MVIGYELQNVKEYYRVKADINLDAIARNAEHVKTCLKPGVKMAAVIKADGYGHGAVPVAKTVYAMADWFAVSNIEEALELRSGGIEKPILTLGYTAPLQLEDAIKNRITLTLCDTESAKEISEAAARIGRPAEVHIKVDTGMGRIGFPAEEEYAIRAAGAVKLPNITATGIYTHFARADEREKEATKLQYDKFAAFIGLLEAQGVTGLLRHAENSAAILCLPEYQLDMVRLGISLYGMYPSEEVAPQEIELQPAMEIKSHVAFLKTVPAGTGIGYNATYVTKEPKRIATVPVGYGDGYPRALSNCGRVLIHGKSAPIVGRVCMDQMMIDVTEIPKVKRGDTVTLMGRDGEERITAEEIGTLSHSFHYEMVCNVGKRIPRVYYKEGEAIGARHFV
ncbi:MAG: alanine racemase [Lachnospiraceae bacterium]|nr:alanine racemase [Lachnospiraceae bacterium]